MSMFSAEGTQGRGVQNPAFDHVFCLNPSLFSSAEQLKQVLFYINGAYLCMRAGFRERKKKRKKPGSCEEKEEAVNLSEACLQLPCPIWA